MKILQKKIILQILKERKWGTLMGVDGRKPYGVEVAYTLVGKYLYVIFNPAGRMARCFRKNKNAAFKICTADSDITSWEAILVEGTMERVVDPVTLSGLSDRFPRSWDTIKIYTTRWLRSMRPTQSSHPCTGY